MEVGGIQNRPQRSSIACSWSHRNPHSLTPESKFFIKRLSCKSGCREVLELAQPSRLSIISCLNHFQSCGNDTSVNFSTFPVSHFEMWTFIQDISPCGIQTGEIYIKDFPKLILRGLQWRLNVKACCNL